MTTFNGQDFLENQLDSIVNQSYENWELIVRDDGSTDKTVEILEEYAKKDNRIKVLTNDTDKHGAYLNFWFLINYATKIKRYDYYFFADQDDIWLTDKLSAYVKAANEKSDSTPLLIYSDMQVIDENSVVTINSIHEVMGIGNMSGLTEFYSSGFVWGCAAMINAALLFFVQPLALDNPHINIMSHDNFYTKICLTIGNVVFLDKPYIQHRRHFKNVTSGNTFSVNSIQVIKKGIFGYKNLAKTHALGYNQTLITINHMRENGINSIILDEVEKAIRKGGIKAVRILKKHKVKRSQFARTLGIYLVMLFKSYKKYLISELVEQKV